jgi:hypothetical protein
MLNEISYFSYVLPRAYKMSRTDLGGDCSYRVA